MRYKIYLSFVTVCTITQLHAVELRMGTASFNWKMGMTFMHTDFDIDANLLSISEQHNNFGNSRFYYFYNADLYRSSFVDKITTLMTTPLTYEFPLVGSFNDAVADHTTVPVPADYRIRGFDLNLGAGYDLWHGTKGVFGIGVNTGLSLPVMKMKNLQKSAQITYDLLEESDTTVRTWKLGPIVHAQYQVAPQLLFYGSFSAGYQTGSIENDWIASSLNVDGSYTTLDLGIRWTPLQTSKDLGWIHLDPKLFITAGYGWKKWEIDDVTIDAFDIAEFSSQGLFENSFDAKMWYLGIGYDF